MTATFVGVSVVPACGGTTTSSDDAGAEAGKDVMSLPDGVAADAFGKPDVFGVAAVAYCCFDAGDEEGG